MNYLQGNSASSLPDHNSKPAPEVGFSFNAFVQVKKLIINSIRSNIAISLPDDLS